MSTADANPSRFWWLKRLTAAGVALLLLLLILRLWWGWIAQRRIDALVEAAKARGEPTAAEDFAVTQPPFPDNQNAVVALKAAITSVSYNPAQNVFDRGFVPAMPVSEADQKMLHGIVTANAKAIALARSMIALPRAYWGVQLTTPISNVMVPRFTGQTQLAKLLRNAAIDEHIHADDAQAVMDLRTIFRQGDALDDAGPFLLANLAAGAVDEIATDAIRQIAGELQIESGGASVAEIRDLIRSVFEDQKHSFMAAQCFYERRLYALEAFDEPLPFLDWKEPVESWIFKPTWQLQAVQQFQDSTAVAHALREPTFSAALAKLPTIPITNRLSPLYRASHQYTMYMPSYNNWVKAFYRGLAERSTAAVLLALRLFESDHGSPPANLDALVPDYIPAVPVDPLSADGHVLRYLATPGKEAVYSVGLDGLDDGGSTQLPAPASGKSNDPWNMRDAVFPFHPVPPNPPATAPVQ